MRDQTIIGAFQQLQNRQDMMENQLMSVSQVLKEIVGKELMRAQALHKVLMDKGLFTDADLKTALETIIAEAQADLKAQAEKVAAEKQSKVEILVPNTVKADSNQDATPTPAVIPVTENPSGSL
jgi:hypothetical protein